MSGITGDLTFYDGAGTDDGQVIGRDANDKIGFYGTTPIAQQAAPTDAASIIVLLQALGLCAAS